MPKEITIRIALAVDSNGEWNVAGWDGCDDDHLKRQAATVIRQNAGEGVAVSEMWITATIPLPEPLPNAGVVAGFVSAD